MGNYTIVVQGTGTHHNNKAEGDANVIAEKFVQELKAKGHHVHHASITHGGKKKSKALLAAGEGPRLFPFSLRGV